MFFLSLFPVTQYQIREKERHNEFNKNNQERFRPFKKVKREVDNGK